MKINILEDVRKIFVYNNWANERLIQNIKQVRPDDYIKILPIPFSNLHGLLHHLYYYDAKYYCEIMGDKNIAIKNKNELTRELLFQKITMYSNNWNEWIDKLVNRFDTENLSINYEHIFDLHSHNSYHRGQINIIISMLGYKPLSLDVFLHKQDEIREI